MLNKSEQKNNKILKYRVREHKTMTVLLLSVKDAD